MTERGSAPPTGYVRVTSGGCAVTTLSAYADDARALLADGTLYEAAARDLSARHFHGRGIAYAIALPVSRERVVVRHNRHGGLLAAATRDLFLPPTRAPYELAVARRLAEAGVRTPTVLMYGVTPAALLFRRADVVTREIIGGRDLASYLAPAVSDVERSLAWAATRQLVRALNAAGARHHDLNVKNVLLAHGAAELDAYILDVDRITFHEPMSEVVRQGNRNRLLRSARKWRDERGATVNEKEILSLDERSRNDTAPD
jgi:hypothetical protein